MCLVFGGLILNRGSFFFFVHPSRSRPDLAHQIKILRRERLRNTPLSPPARSCLGREIDDYHRVLLVDAPPASLQGAREGARRERGGREGGGRCTSQHRELTDSISIRNAKNINASLNQVHARSRPHELHMRQS